MAAVGVEAGLAVVVEQILQAPRSRLLVGGDLVTAMHELSQYTSQKVGIAMIPAREQRMREVNDPHAAASLHEDDKPPDSTER